MITKIRGERGGGSGQEVDIQADRNGGMHIAQMLPPYALLSALGKGYSAHAVSAIAALVQRPGATAALTLWNGEADGGLCYIIDRVAVHQLVSTTAEARFGLWLCIHTTGMGATATSITVIDSYRGISTYGGNARVETGATVNDDGWHPWGDSVDVEISGALPGAQVDMRPEGRIIIPPSAGISAHVVASLTGDTFTIGFSWYEVQLDLG